MSPIDLSKARRSPTPWVVIAALLLPVVLDPYYMGIAIFTVIMVGLCSAWNIVGGMAGLFSFAHSLFIASGSLLVVALHVEYGLSPWLGMLAGALVAAILSAAVAWLTDRFGVTHLSFALITLAFSEIGLLLVLGTPFLGGAAGLYIPRLPTSSLTAFQFSSATVFFYVALAFTGVTIAIAAWVLRSKIGYYLRALKDNEDAAKGIGINIRRYKIVAMMISGALTACMATAYTQYLLYVDPYRFAGPLFLIEIVLFTTVGGLGTIWGPIVGAGLLVPMGEILRGELGGIVPGLHYVIFGLIIVLVCMYMPEGIVGRFRTYRRGRATKTSDAGVRV